MANPYNTDTPEWQLHANLEAAELLAVSLDADAARATKRAIETREKVARYRAALLKLEA